MSKFHSKYWAHALTLKHSSANLANLSRSISNARVDLNPHQVRAALFALKSPLSKGVILADEVGLGKTIEASLVIAQKWAERKRHILLIVPASLRKQWEAELKEKFYLPAKVLDSKQLKQDQLNGSSNPFDTRNHIIICSYPFVVDQSQLIQNIEWDLVIIDEAHRLRNVYKTSNKQAKAITEAIGTRPKLLLTATPLQNNLMELYGLISIVDPQAFGDPEAFRVQYAQPKVEHVNYQQLRDRLKPLVIRTLRKEVQGYVSFTNRLALTQLFHPTDDEQKLYEGVSAYLQKEDILALPKGQRQLLIQVMRKLLASSPVAILPTLKGLVSKLEKQGGPEILLDPEELEVYETTIEDFKEDGDSTKQNNSSSESQTVESKSAIRQEILELQSYIELGENIKKNTKSEALLVALQKAFEQAEKLGAPKKVVIFTESRRTQKFLFSFLSENGYSDQLVLINGNNTDPHSKKIYDEWIIKHQQSDKITGSKAVDMKAAIVEKFRDEGNILIATEAAAEGINLQFCSLIVNYDLPWNPQRVEQRIGRCHRYGQKFDVVVINFINERNEADKRVYELLRDKFKLFDGVFGASDEVLGAIESGVDIEKRIANIYQTCRTPGEIKFAFDKLRADLDVEIQENIKQAKSSIFEHLDEDVVSLLKIQQDAEALISQREKLLFNIVCEELSIPSSDLLPYIEIPIGDNSNKKFFLNWKIAEEQNSNYLREDDPHISPIIDRSIRRNLSPAEVVFNYSNYDRKISVLENFLGKTGILELHHLKFDTFDTEEFLLFTAITDSGERLDQETAEKLFQLPAEVLRDIEFNHDLNQLRMESEQKINQEVEERTSQLYDQEVGKLDLWADDLKLGLELQLKSIEKDIKEARKASALAKTFAEKLENQKKLKELESQRAAKRRALYSEQDRIEEKREELISRLEKRLQPSITRKHLFSIRWTLK